MTTGVEDMSPEERDDLLAAEYVLGTLDHAERLAAARKAGDDPGFAARVAAWQARLAPLDAQYDDVPAPPLLPAIEARLFGRAPARAPFWRRFWGGLGLGMGAGFATLVLAVALLAPGLFTPRPAMPALGTTLSADAGALVFAARYDRASGMLEVTRMAGGAAPTGRDYELWSIAKGGQPIPLGVMRGDSMKRKVPGLTPGMILAVSMEPRGGAPDGKPTKVMATGVIVAL